MSSCSEDEFFDAEEHVPRGTCKRLEPRENEAKERGKEVNLAEGPRRQVEEQLESLSQVEEQQESRGQVVEQLESRSQLEEQLQLQSRSQLDKQLQSHSQEEQLELQRQILLEEQDQLQKRREEEDRQLEKKLQELEQLENRHRVKQTQQQDLKKQANENETKRQKLERLRELMCEESTPRRNSPPPPAHLTPGVQKARSLAGQAHAHLAGQGHTVEESEVRDNLVNDDLEKGQMFMRYFSDVNSSLGRSGDTAERAGPEASSLTSEGRGAVLQASSGSMLLTEDSQHSHEPPIPSKSSHKSFPSSHENPANERPPVIHCDPHEPDLIQSVKTSSLARAPQASPPRHTSYAASAGEPEMPPPPLVPPRRKKRVQSEVLAAGERNNGSKDSIVEVGTRPKSLGNANEPISDCLTTSACLLTAPSPQVGRKALDMSCVMQGERVVTASEEECTRAVNDLHIDAESHEAVEGPPEASAGGADSEVVEGAGARESVKSHSFPRSNSTASPSHSVDKGVLETVSVLNLDTGERIPLSEAEGKVPCGVNPLSLHIMRRTKEYLSDPKLHHSAHDIKADDSQTITTVKAVGKRKKKLKKFFGKAKQKIKTVKDEVFHNAESSPSDSEEESDESRRMIKIKASNSHKGPYDFDLLVPVQDISNAHSGAVWTMRFSLCGRLLASGGQDNLLRVWVLRDAFNYFDDMRHKYNEERRRRMSPTRSENSSDSQTTFEAASEGSGQPEGGEDWFAPFIKKPFCTYRGHSADILDISWSKNYFLLTSSMDKTVRLWHVSRKECLCCFQHIDFVTAIAFHPKDDRYFLSGSLDGKLRLWNIPDKKVALWNEVSGSSKLITAANFCLNAKFAVVGTYDGRCVFYSTEQLKYYTQIHVRSTRGKNAKGRKVTGVEPFPGEDKILVTSNDSRIRLYDLRDLTLTCKYRGCLNNSSQIKASFSHNGRFLVCGSEDQFVYIWRVQHELHAFSSARRDRSQYWEAIKAHSHIVTVAMFSPRPHLIIKPQFEYLDSDDKQSTPDVRGEVLISADYNGTIKVFINKFKPGTD